MPLEGAVGMKQRYIGLAMGAVIALGSALSLPSCGHQQKLVSLQVQPPNFTFLVADKNQTFPYKAYGTYIHPPETKDITDQVTWFVNSTEVVEIASGTPPGTVTTVGGCGVSDVVATAPEGTGGSSNIVVGYATVTVDNPGIAYCPGGSSQQATLAVVLAGSGEGAVASVPAGLIACPGPCGAQILVGNLVVLQAKPNTDHSFVSWNGCTPGNPSTTCSLTMPADGVLVSATFD
jgi:Divergent InlB B-repeat domain